MLVISLCALKNTNFLLFYTVRIKARGQGTWPKQRRKPSTKKKATHKKENIFISTLSDFEGISLELIRN